MEVYILQLGRKRRYKEYSRTFAIRQIQHGGLSFEKLLNP